MDVLWHAMLQSKHDFMESTSLTIVNSVLCHCIFSATVKMNHGIVFLKEEINFQHIFKVSKTSIHYETITKLVRRYFEAGMLDRIFLDIHRESHK